MDKVGRFLVFCGAYGRFALFFGIVLGLAMPQLAGYLRPLIPYFIGSLIFLAALRAKALPGRLRWGELRRDVITVLVLQVVVPLVLFGLFRLIGWQGVLANAVLMVSAAPAISGLANLALMSGLSSDAALRLQLLGTLATPFLAPPLLAMMIGAKFSDHLFRLAFGLGLLILLVMAVATLVRRSPLGPALTARARALDGLGALIMMVFVIALMAAVQPAIIARPGMAAVTFIVAVAANTGMVVLFVWGARARAIPAINDDDYTRTVALAAGNRNGALFLAVMPAAVMEPMLLFIGCYQIPMYLSPLLSRYLFTRRHGPSDIM